MAKLTEGQIKFLRWCNDEYPGGLYYDMIEMTLKYGYARSINKSELNRLRTMLLNEYKSWQTN